MAADEVTGARHDDEIILRHVWPPRQFLFTPSFDLQIPHPAGRDVQRAPIAD
jgi:hypothetical protein